MFPSSVAVINGCKTLVPPRNELASATIPVGVSGRSAPGFGRMKLPGRVPAPAASCTETCPLAVSAMKNEPLGWNAMPQGFCKTRSTLFANPGAFKSEDKFVCLKAMVCALAPLAANRNPPIKNEKNRDAILRFTSLSPSIRKKTHVQPIQWPSNSIGQINAPKKLESENPVVTFG